MNAIWIAVFGLLGLFAGSIYWVIARNQAARRPLFAAPGDDQRGVVPGLLGWLPVYGVAASRAGSDEGSLGSKRLAFEAGVAGYWAFAAWHLSDWRQLIAVLIFTAPLLVILLVDAWTRLVHTNVIIAGILLGLAFAALGGFRDLLSSALGLAIGALVFAFFFGLAIVIYRNPNVVPFGLGDVYLAAMIGAMVTSHDVLRALMYGIFFGGFCIVVLLGLKRVSRKQAIPYGPFLVVGALLALLF